MQRLRFLFLVGLVLWGMAGLVSAQEEMPLLFTLASEDPVISPSEDTTRWDGKFTDPGAVLYHEGRFHMFRNGFNAWPATVQIGYLYSEDGIQWTAAAEEPVLYSADVPYAEVAALASSAMVEDDGTWVLYFYTWNGSSGASNEGGAIGRATAPDPIGPWTLQPEPVLTAGGAGAWDSHDVSAPSVVKTATGYLMYYAGTSVDAEGNVFTAIGLAQSADGLRWTKYDDAMTTEAPFAESDPILQTFTAEQRLVHQPRVVQTPQGFVMVFRSLDHAVRGTMKLNYALSADGLRWIVPDPIAFWTAQSMPGRSGKNFWWTGLAYAEDQFYLYIEGQHRLGTHIFLATHQGPVPERGQSSRIADQNG